MLTVAQVQQLLVELELLVDSIEAIWQLSENRWGIVFDDQSELGVECDATTAKLTFVSDVGPVQDQIRFEAYDVLLSYNSLYSETGGVRMAIDEPRGHVLQLFDLVNPDIRTLIDVTLDLKEKAAGWRDALGNMTVKEDPSDDLPSHAIFA